MSWEKFMYSLKNDLNVINIGWLSLVHTYIKKLTLLDKKKKIEKRVEKVLKAIFLSTFYFSPNDSSSKTMKNVFYFI